MLWQWNSIKTGINIVGHVMMSHLKIMYYKQHLAMGIRENH